MYTSKTTIVIPCRNEEFAIKKLLLEIKSLKIAGLQIIVVDDGSTDNTEGIVKEIASNFEKILSIRCIRLDQSVGKIRAQSFGILSVEADSGLILMDGDGQHPTRYIPQLSKSPYLEFPKVGIRKNYKRSCFSKIGALILHTICKLFGINYSSEESEFISLSSQQVRIIQNDLFLGLSPINSILYKNFSSVENFEFTVDERFSDHFESENYQTNTRHDLSSLLKKAILILFSDPWKILIRLSALQIITTLVFMTYGLVIGIRAISTHNLSGTSTVILIVSLLASLTWFFSTVIIGVLVMLREELTHLRSQNK